MILSGKEASSNYFVKLREKISRLPKAPMLTAIQVGDNPASNTYLRLKEKKLLELGLGFQLFKFEENISQEEIIAKIEELNNDENINGILVQLPLPENFDTQRVLNAVVTNKDVDCLNELSLGKFFAGKDNVYPATAKGVIRLLEYYKIPVEGQKICLIGRSNLVTKPLAIQLIKLSATVTVCHSKTKNLSEETKAADIVISGIGKAGFLTEEYFKPGQTIVDIGTSLDEEGKLSGDIDFDEVEKIVENITPVPGGVGPMTIYGLVENLVSLASE